MKLVSPGDEEIACQHAKLKPKKEYGRRQRFQQLVRRRPGADPMCDPGRNADRLVARHLLRLGPL
jgi:hypothetical protein